MATARKLNSELEVGDTVQYWNSFATIISITDRRFHPTVGKECVSLNFADKVGMTAFLDDYSTVAIPSK